MADAAPLPEVISRAEALKNSGNDFLRAGDPASAVREYHAAITLFPNFAHAHANLGVALSQLGQLDDARDAFTRAIVIDPSLANAYFQLAVLQFDQGDLDAAALTARAGLEHHPQLPSLHNCLAKILIESAQYDSALFHCRAALNSDPAFVPALCNLAVALERSGRLEEALGVGRQALALSPDLPVVHLNLGIMLVALHREDEAQVHFRQALALDPDFAEAHFHLGGMLYGRQDIQGAIACYRRAIASKPDYAEAYANLGSALVSQGALDETIAINRKAIAYRPDLAVAHSNLIFALDLAVDATLATQQEERRRWDLAHAASLPPPSTHYNRADPERRLRIGYVSGDFRTHLGGCVFAAMLMRFDPARFEIYAYSNGSPEDATTQPLKRNVTVWREIGQLADDAAAALIRSDEIDILVDLSGHSPANRLLVFAHKPAPIQVTAWGFATSTGMRAMDAFFADPVIVPPGERALYVEEICYLPNVISYYQPQTLPTVNPLPATTAGYVTFGSLNRLVKISSPAFALWAEVLHAVPNSRMLIKAAELDDPAAQARIMRHFTDAGIAPDRIVLRGRTSWFDHLATFNRIDIALDPFPHGGGVTALEGLAMGVPYVALRWPTIVGRTSVSILTTMGLANWIAESTEQYVAIARQQARALDDLAALRGTLRERFERSPIADTSTYACAVEREYRRLWRKWCGHAQGVRP